jgi:hypothetical protein
MGDAYPVSFEFLGSLSTLGKVAYLSHSQGAAP